MSTGPLDPSMRAHGNEGGLPDLPPFDLTSVELPSKIDMSQASSANFKDGIERMSNEGFAISRQVAEGLKNAGLNEGLEGFQQAMLAQRFVDANKNAALLNSLPRAAAAEIQRNLSEWIQV